MPSKSFIKAPRKQRIKTPETADEFLEFGVTEEESGEKWRSGDAVKSTRAFLRAIEVYSNGLQRYPQSFDLAYNKARLQYDLSQQPRLVEQQPRPLLELLLESIQSHRYVLDLAPDDTNTIFNAAQVYVSFAEALRDTKGSIDVYTEADIPMILEDAIAMFSSCYESQQAQLHQFATEFGAAVEEEARIQQSSDTFIQEKPTKRSQNEDDEGESAYKEEPISTETLIDTQLAKLQAWTVLEPYLDPMNPRPVVLDIERTISDCRNLLTTMNQKDQTPNLIIFSSTAALQNYAFKSGHISAKDYTERLASEWVNSGLQNDGPGLCEYADALITMDAALSTDKTALLIESPSDIANMRWKALGKAAEALKTADKNPGPANRVDINGQRGDVELLRARLGESPTYHKVAVDSRDVLLRNAEIYYQGAHHLAMDDVGRADSMTARSLVAKALREKKLKSLLDEFHMDASAIRIKTVIDEMIEDGLVAKRPAID